MAINIGTAKSPHGQAAASLEEEVSKTTLEAGPNGEEEKTKEMDYQSTPVHMATPYETIEVGTSFKMPVAQYTMLEFTVRRSVPFNPLETDADTIFDETKVWVEAKLNAIIAEQQAD